MSAPATQQPSSTSSLPSKRPASQTPQKASTLTLSSPSHAYIHLTHLAPSQDSLPSDLDTLTAHHHLTTSLHQFLGVHGAAVPIDVLKLSGRDVWVRVPAADRSAVVAAAGGWIGRQGEGWRVVGWGSWGLGSGGEGRDLFGN
ncbi:hypothetical protein WHR41_08558 [Cladosporium halotolerans]|uniref:Ribonucleases P/MRP subunit Pop8-like domain-containing protein n=1 Tax=Cladosporium halotolerans TaxID=1052096 RepID=A0AB34KBV1_9PEZI